MRNFAIIAGLVLALGACKKDKWEQAVSDTEGFRDKMCACKDKACTEDVHKQYKDWEKGLKDKMGKDDMPSDKIMERAEKADKEMRDCRKKFRDDAAAPTPEGGAPAPTPPAPTPAPAGSGAAPATP